MTLVRMANNDNDDDDDGDDDDNVSIYAELLYG